MSEHVVLLSVPGLRGKDLATMPNLSALVAGGDRAPLVASFPCVTCPVQANMTTGELPAQHGVVANGFYWSDDRQSVEMWTAWNDAVQVPQIWEVLHKHDAKIRSAVWFPLLAKGAKAEWICTPAPIHNPDGSESLWCYTQPTELYGELRDALGHFPLKHFWGPLAGIQSTQWIIDSAVQMANAQKPNFFYIYLPHLDYAAQKFGPDSAQAQQALVDLDGVLARLIAGFNSAYGGLSNGHKIEPLWLVASEYAIAPVDHVVYPNRILREAGLLAVREEADGEHLDLAASKAWALVDHQFSHIFLRGGADRDQVQKLFEGREGIDEVLVGDNLAKYELNHRRSGQVVLVSSPNSWQAYYWWLDDSRAPAYARTVDIHRKPGYDPVELFFDPATRGIPLNASLVKGSHGAPVRDEWQQGVMLTSQPGVLEGPPMADTDVFELVLRQFGI